MLLFDIFSYVFLNVLTDKISCIKIANYRTYLYDTIILLYRQNNFLLKLHPAHPPNAVYIAWNLSYLLAYYFLPLFILV